MKIEVKCSIPELSFFVEFTDKFVAMHGSPREAMLHYFHNLHLPENLNQPPQ